MQSKVIEEGVPKEVFLVQDGTSWRVYWNAAPAKSMRTQRRNWGRNAKPCVVWRAVISHLEEVP